MKMKKTSIATIALMMLLSSLNVHAISYNLISKASEEPLIQSYAFLYNMALPTGELVPAYQNRTITVFPNNTVETFIEIIVDEFPQYHLRALPGQHLVQVNATRRFQAQSGLLSKILSNFEPKGEYTLVSSEPHSEHSESADLMQYTAESYATLGSYSESIRPLNTTRLPTKQWPDALIPPILPGEFDWWDTKVLQLQQGYVHPTNEDPIEILYHQPDNYFNYPNETHKRDWGAEWAFVNTLFCSHINKTKIDELEHGEVTQDFFLTQRIAYLGLGLDVTGGLVAGIPAILLGVGLVEKGLVVSVICPALGLAILFLGAIVTIYAASKAAEYFSTKDWIDQALRTSKGDSFCYLKILTDLTFDVSWRYGFWGNGGSVSPVTVIFTQWKRHYMECFGKELMQGKWTEIVAETGYFVSSVTKAIALPSLTDQCTWWPGPYFYP
jgi:hypothetical protein